MSDLPTMNQPDVLEGRMPKKDNECFMDIDFMKMAGYKVGDTVKLESGTEEGLDKTLKHSSYKIVGAGSSPCYISFERGSSTIGTGEVSGFIIVTPETFLTEVYTEGLIEVEGAKQETAFTAEYDSKVEKVSEKIKEIEDVQCRRRQQEIVSEAQDKISKSETELNKAKQTAKEELDSAQKTISDGEKN